MLSEKISLDNRKLKRIKILGHIIKYKAQNLPERRKKKEKKKKGQGEKEATDSAIYGS